MTSDPGSRRARVLWWVGGFVVLAVFLITSPLASTSVIINTHSNTSGSSDMAFSVDGAGKTSAVHATVQLNHGENSLNFHFGGLNFPFTNQQIWNVCDCDAQLTVTSVELHNHLLSEVVPLSDLSASGGMPTLHRAGERIALHNAPTVDLHPRVAITANTGGFVLLVDGLMILLAAIVTALVFLIVALLGSAARSGGALGRWMRRLRARVRTAIIDAQSPGPVSASAVIRLPTALLVIAVAVLVINLVVMYWGASHIGIFVDEPTHVRRLIMFFERGWYLQDGELSNGLPKAGLIGNYVYGPVGEMFGHSIAVLTGADPIGNVMSTPAAYAARHLSVAILATGAIASTAATVRVLLRSWRWGLVAAAILSAIPTFAGQSMFNPKDIPVLAGYSAVTLAFVLIGHSTTLSSRIRTVGAAALLIVGSVFMVGTRIGTWPVLVATPVILVLGALLFAPAASGLSNRLVRAALRGAVAVASELIAWVILTCIYPKAFEHPLTVLGASFSGSADYTSGTTASTHSFRASSHAYIASWLIIQIPTLLLLLSAIGLAIGIVACVRVLIRRSSSTSPDMALAIALVGGQLLLVPVFTFVKHSELYQGLRQLLFIMPALAIFATLGVVLLVSYASRRQRGRTGLTVFAIAISATAIVLPSIEQAMLFPYAANYVTAASRLVPYSAALSGRVSPGALQALGEATGETNTALREAAPHVHGNTTIVCNGVLGTIDVEKLVCLSARALAPYTSGTPSSGSLFDSAGSASYLKFDVPLAPGQVRSPTNERCTILKDVTRPTLLGAQVILDIQRCTRAAAAIAVPSTLSFAAGASSSALFSNWYAASASGVSSLGTRSAIQVSVPTSITSALELQFTGYRLLAPGQTGILRVIVNGVSLATTTFPASMQRETTTVRVPHDVADKGHDGALSIQFVTPEPESRSDIYGGSRATYPQPAYGYFLETMSTKAATASG